MFYSDALDKEYEYIALSRHLGNFLSSENNKEMSSGTWHSAALDGKGHGKHIGKRSLLRVGGLICMAQANQIEAPIYIPARPASFDLILV